MGAVDCFPNGRDLARTRAVCQQQKSQRIVRTLEPGVQRYLPAILLHVPFKMCVNGRLRIMNTKQLGRKEQEIMDFLVRSNSSFGAPVVLE